MDVSDSEVFEEESESKCVRVKVAIGSMCGPRDVAVDSPTVTTAAGESTGQDRSSAAGIFVLTVEHVHGGGGVLLFVIVIILALAQSLVGGWVRRLCTGEVHRLRCTQAPCPQLGWWAGKCAPSTLAQ